MDAKLKADWIAALRSGEFKQGSGWLRKAGKHCCLGVLCATAGLKISDDGMAVINRGKPSGYRPLKTKCGVPDSVVSEAYMRNDGGESFPEIADWLEANPDV